MRGGVKAVTKDSGRTQLWREIRTRFDAGQHRFQIAREMQVSQSSVLRALKNDRSHRAVIAREIEAGLSAGAITALGFSPALVAEVMAGGAAPGRVLLRARGPRQLSISCGEDEISLGEARRLMAAMTGAEWTETRL